MFGLGKGKGEIDIKLNSYNFSPGDLIEGVVSLKVKKPVKAEGVHIRLVGQEWTTVRTYSSRRVGTSRTYGPGPAGTSKTKRKIFEFKQPLDSAREYQPGEQDYPFKIKIPQNVLTQTTPTSPTSVVEAIMTAASAPSYIVWELTANLDIPGGFDVSKTVQINIA